MDTSNSITSLARNNDSILDPIQSSGTQHLGNRTFHASTRPLERGRRHDAAIRGGLTSEWRTRPKSIPAVNWPRRSTVRNVAIQSSCGCLTGNRVVPLDNFMIYKDIIRLDRPD
ncbi:MAG: hypothetical protein [Olavius algarvensis Gamma 1 endosymbiont]|nr:MAG: hypothetical protein [Olavius algarvensis Gamma 1 endosymbiont]